MVHSVARSKRTGPFHRYPVGRSTKRVAVFPGNRDGENNNGEKNVIGGKMSKTVSAEPPGGFAEY